MSAKPKTIEGVKYVPTHFGQKKAYGDTFYEYEIESALPAAEVERVCATLISKAIPKAEWLVDYRQPGCSMEKAFRPHYTLTARGPGKWFYQVRMLYTD